MSGQARMSWIKLWIDDCLEGPIRFKLTPDERSVYYELELMAGKSETPGYITQDEQTPYPSQYIAGVLNISLELLERSLAKLQQLNKIALNDGGIRMLDWDKHQSEYQRQKKYRTPQPGQNPEKYKRGKYGHLVQH